MDSGCVSHEDSGYIVRKSNGVFKKTTYQRRVRDDHGCQRGAIPGSGLRSLHGLSRFPLWQKTEEEEAVQGRLGRENLSAGSEGGQDMSTKAGVDSGKAGYDEKMFVNERRREEHRQGGCSWLK